MSDEPSIVEVVIDRERCMGSGNCAYWAAGTFDLDDDLRAVVVGDPNADRDRVVIAADECPTAAIRLRFDR